MDGRWRSFNAIKTNPPPSHAPSRPRRYDGSHGGAPEQAPSAAVGPEADRAFLAWEESVVGRALIGAELRALRSAAAARLVADMLETQEGREGLLAGLGQAVSGNSGLAAQLRALLQH